MAAKKEIKVNQTDETVPSAEDAPETSEGKITSEDVAEYLEAVFKQAIEDGIPLPEWIQNSFTIPAEVVHDINPLFLGSPAGDLGRAIEDAQQSDQVDAWNKVADMLYAVEQHKPKWPGLHASRLGRLLERLP